MIFTFQIIDGFETLLGPETIHIPMFISVLVFMRYPEEDTPNLVHSRELWYQAAFFHGIASLHHLARRFKWAVVSNFS